MVPVVANAAFATGPEDEDIHSGAMEVEQWLLLTNSEGEPRQIRETDLGWIKEHWWNAGKLMYMSSKFNLLFQACRTSASSRATRCSPFSCCGAA